MKDDFTVNNIIKIAKLFLPTEKVLDLSPLGNGHINTTYLVTTNKAKYTLQMINTRIFTDVEGLMSNIDKVTNFLRSKATQKGKDPSRVTLEFLDTIEGKKYAILEDHAYRMYKYIDGVYTIEKMEDPQSFYYSGIAFGEFAKELKDFDASQLVETIKNFHNTVSRYNDFEDAVMKNASGRAFFVADEIKFVRERKEFTSLFIDKLNDGSLPLRVTHNDTKLNNVLMDEKTGLPVAVIDLDTVMPGSYLYDFGDAIRFGATRAAEDEQDLSIVNFEIDLFEKFAQGYLEMCGDSLTDTEIEMLPYASIMLTLECGMRFLGDHINGDVYFKIHREDHNLDRARTQFKLVSDMEKNIDNMKAVINKILNR
jgi:Ser/Thr protein kinase RdoA (MazF antagonist)